MFFTKTVDQVVKKFTDAMDDLEAIANHQTDEQQSIRDKMSELDADLIVSEREHRRAKAIAAKLRALISD